MPILNTGQIFASGDQVTSQKLMDIADLATFDDPADGSTIIVNSQTYGISGGDGKLKVPSGGITSNELASDSVTTAKIVDGAVTSAKLNSDTISILVPTAIVLPYAGTNAPQGFLFCVGQTLLVADYTDLHNAIGYTYGGSGSSFKLPDLRGRVIAGKDNMEGTSADRLTGLTGGVDGDVLGGTGGDEKHDLTEAQMPKHYHQMRGPNAVTAPQGGETSGTGVYGGGTADDTPEDYATFSTGGSASSGSSSTGTANGNSHNNVQPTMILNYIIKT